MSGIVGQAGATQSGAIGNLYSPGSIVQTVTATNTNESAMTVSPNNTWADTDIQANITPKFRTSTLMIHTTFNCNMTNTTGDGGYGVRLKQTILGGSASYPSSISAQEGTSNAHSIYYEAGTSGRVSPGVRLDTNTLCYITYPDTTTQITYVLQGAAYNLTTCQIGGDYTSYWYIHLQEIKV